MRSLLTASVIGVSLYGASAPVAQVEAQPAVERRHVRFDIVTEHADLIAGETNLLGLRFTIEPKWHVYWRGRNDTGFPIAPEWKLPADWEAGELQWPAPHRYEAPGDILDHIYEEEVTLLLPIKVPEGAVGSRVTIPFTADWLACREACVFENGKASISLSVVSDESETRRGKGARSIETTRGRLPKKITGEEGEPKLEWRNGSLIVMETRPYEWIAFYPREDSIAVADPLENAKVKKDSLTLTPDRDAPGDGKRIIGMLEIRLPGEKPSLIYEVDSPLPEHEDDR